MMIHNAEYKKKKKQWTIHFKSVCSVLCELHFSKAVQKNKITSWPVHCHRDKFSFSTWPLGFLCVSSTWSLGNWTSCYFFGFPSTDTEIKKTSLLKIHLIHQTIQEEFGTRGCLVKDTSCEEYSWRCSINN